jgi:hypothetical membrane protein
MALERLRKFADRYPLAGPLLWVSIIQYYVVQIIAAHAWTRSFSLTNNPISDLGNTACGTYYGRFVCSPEHILMNVSFILLGAAMILGSWLICCRVKASYKAQWGFRFMALAGVGTILVGLFPENANHVFHVLGASLAFIFGNLALVCLGLSLAMPRVLRYFAVVFGSIALVALVMSLIHIYVGLGPDGIERLIAYPQSIWMIWYGINVLVVKRNRTAI